MELKSFTLFSGTQVIQISKEKEENKKDENNNDEKNNEKNDLVLACALRTGFST